MSTLPLEIDIHQTKKLLESGEITLLDCREEHEYETSSIEGAVLVPMSQIQSKLGELEQFKSRHVVVHCHHGGRSLRVTNFLRQQGFESSQSMAGGIDAWSLEIDETIPRY